MWNWRKVAEAWVVLFAALMLWLAAWMLYIGAAPADFTSMPW